MQGTGSCWPSCYFSATYSAAKDVRVQTKEAPMSLSQNMTFAATGGFAAVANHLADELADQAHPPAGRFVEIDGVRVHVLEKGAGPPVLYLHGNGGMMQEVQATGLVEHISADHHLIVVDRPGFGHSSRPPDRLWTPEKQAELITKLLSSLGLPPVVVIAHSWGAMVATAMAIHHAAHVRGLVLVGGCFYPASTSAYDNLLSAFFAATGAANLIRYGAGPVVRRLSAQAAILHVFAPDQVTSRFEELYPVRLAVRSSQLDAVREDTNAIGDAAARLSALYSQIHCPVSIVAGSADNMVDFEQSKRLAHEIAWADLEIVVGKGHMLPHVVPEVVMAALSRLENDIEQIGEAAGSEARSLAPASP